MAAVTICSDFGAPPPNKIKSAIVSTVSPSICHEVMGPDAVILVFWPRQHIKNHRHYFANKGLSSQSYGFSSSNVWMWELDYKESWAPVNWCFWTVVLEKTLESPLDCKEIQSVHPKGDQSWVFIGRTDVEAETPIFLPPDVKSWLIWKDPDAGYDLRQEEGGWQRIRWLDGIADSMDMSLSKLWGMVKAGKPGMLQSMGLQRVRRDWATEQHIRVWAWNKKWELRNKW